MIGQVKLTRMKTRAGKKDEYYRTPDYRIGNRPHTTKFKVVSNVGPTSIYFVHSIVSNLHSRNCWSRWAPESRCFANLTEEDLQEIIDNKDL